MKHTRTAGKPGLNLNEQQQLAVKHHQGPALVLAGPGSGKTTVITARAAHLIQNHHIHPSQILTLTYNKAAQLEMNNRFLANFGGSITEKVHFSTLHSFCFSVLRDYERRQGNRFTLIEGHQGGGLSKANILNNIFREVNQSQISDDELDMLINEIGLVKNKMLKEADFKDEELQTRNFSLVYKAYEEYKKRQVLIDFDDMLTYAFSILIRCPDLLAGYQARFTHFQVDEAQDLSKIQFEILKLLVGSNHPNLFLVADDDQSIYGFRGADPSQILGIGKFFSECRIYMLENNYRSSKNIVALSSSFIRHNEKRFDKQHVTSNSPVQEPEVITVEDMGAQMDFVIRKITSLQQSFPHQSIALLYRTNLSSIPLLDALDRSGIAYSLRQNKVHFHKHWLVLDLMAFLRFSQDPKDGESFGRIYYKLNRYISKSRMEEALTMSGSDIVDAIYKIPGLNGTQAKKILLLKTEFKKMSKMKPIEALDYIEDHFKYFGYVKDFCDTTGQSFQYQYGLFDILRCLAQHQKTIPAFIRRVEALEMLLDDLGAMHKGAAVTLSTLHASKGLEFDSVFMVDLINDEIPGQRAISLASKKKEATLLEEERRLFYVGMTRARTQLYMIAPESKNGMLQARSTFMNEVMEILNKDTSDRLIEGMVIHHKKYGRGILSRIDASKPNMTILLVDFKGKSRSLDLATCLEHGIISFPVQ